jgi:putative ABC transport system ATP-binding protein
MRSQPIIKIQNIDHFYGKGHLRKQILFDINAEINAGEIVFLTGPSGSGKTTLLTLVGALRSVQSGSLQVSGIELKGASQQLLVRMRRKIGYIFQEHNLLNSLTASQNVQMAMGLHKEIPKKMARQRANEMLEAVGLGDYLKTHPQQLSVGQKQRVAIARALVSHPNIVLADEPTASLDKKSGLEVIELMHGLAKRQNCTILTITHDSRILHFADRLLNLEDGRLNSLSHLAIDEKQGVLTNYAKVSM